VDSNKSNFSQTGEVLSGTALITDAPTIKEKGFKGQQLRTVSATPEDATPPSQEIFRAASSQEDYNDSLQKSLRHFVETVSNSKTFDAEDFDLALKSNAVLLGSQKLDRLRT